jgi:predicted metalloprotease
MRWTPGGTSDNVEDRRGVRIGRAGAGIGVGGVLLLGLLSLVTGQNFFALLGPLVDTDAPVTEESRPVDSTPEEDRRVQFVSFVLDDAQRTWARLLPGRDRDAKLVLFRDAVRSGCGTAESAMGPFYCPEDEKAYIDLGFYDDLRRRFGARGGDFAQAYVLTHEIGHHVQHLLGIDRHIRGLQEEQPDAANELSVRLELQADCLAGVWGHSTGERDILEPGDIDDALNAAAAIGDDRIQTKMTGRVDPESFTHGSAQQRVYWFRRGFDRGTVDACDTFAGDRASAS